ncbi:MAG: LPXTG cell wall anchor domain-containing protein [Lachnospiraceae bacterium]|nr:LPXTG cell wall anchor domain-containing protein [Lachnospiraceae bacterium]
MTGVTTFYFKGVDAGRYKLVETTVPAGYNKADDLVFSVEATYDTTSDNPELKTLVVKDASGKVVSEGTEAIFTATLRTGAVSTDVQNLSGTELPATGGIGTKIFYTVGAIIMIVAAVLLITRKRTAKN